MSRILAALPSVVLLIGCSGADSTEPSRVEPGVSDLAPETVSFSNGSFRGVAISQPFEALITPGPFSVQVTVASDLVEFLEIDTADFMLRVGFVDEIPDQNERVFFGQFATPLVEVSMPLLDSVHVDGDSDVTVFEFEGSSLEIMLDKGGTLEAVDTRYDQISASLAGESVLLLEDVRPFSIASFTISGRSSATVNLADGAFLSGSAADMSSLGYYGTDVVVLVSSDANSSVFRAGPSRP